MSDLRRKRSCEETSRRRMEEDGGGFLFEA